MNFAVADLHSDLLTYLMAQQARTPFDALSRSSLDQMKEGHVALQVLAVYSSTRHGSSRAGLAQVAHYGKLLDDHHDRVELFQGKLPKDKVAALLAIENAATLCEADEPLAEIFVRLESLLRHFSRIAYLSLTWDGVNRFGGGSGSDEGLTQDGEELLYFLAENSIAIDFSHTSDRLAFEIFDFIDRKRLPLQPIASHSNFRAICDMRRNLPDELAKEIIRRKGVIGMNFFGRFIGPTHHDIVRHVAHALSLGGEEALALGADFFCDHDHIDVLTQKYGKPPFFFDELGSSACYPALFALLKRDLNLSDETLRKIASENATSFLSRK